MCHVYRMPAQALAVSALRSPAPLASWPGLVDSPSHAARGVGLSRAPQVVGGEGGAGEPGVDPATTLSVVPGPVGRGSTQRAARRRSRLSGAPRPLFAARRVPMSPPEKAPRRQLGPTEPGQTGAPAKVSSMTGSAPIPGFRDIRRPIGVNCRPQPAPEPGAGEDDIVLSTRALDYLDPGKRLPGFGDYPLRRSDYSSNRSHRPERSLLDADQGGSLARGRYW